METKKYNNKFSTNPIVSLRDDAIDFFALTGMCEDIVYIAVQLTPYHLVAK